jgi:hypothetical protein
MGGARVRVVVGSHDDGGHHMALCPQVYHHRCVATPLDVLALIAAPGDAAVGKSSLLVRLTDQRFMTNPDPTVRPYAPRSRISSDHLPQLGVEFGSKLIEIPEQGKIVKLQCQCRVPLAARAHLGRVQAGIRPGPSPFARSRARITVVLRGVCSSMT